MEQVLAAIDTVMATGKVVTYAMVSVWADGDGGDVAVDSGVKLLASGLESWRRHGIAALSTTPRQSTRTGGASWASSR